MIAFAITGPPGSGKGTQSEFIIKTFGLEYISTGESLRTEIEKKSDLGLKVKDLMDKGHLVNDDIVGEIITNVINDCIRKKSKGILFDGYPRTVSQAIFLNDVLTKNNIFFAGIIGLEVDEPILVNRILKRALMSGRNDDNKESIIKRLEVYKEKTAPIIDYYSNIGKYYPVNGDKSIEDVTVSVVNIITEMI